MTNSYKIIDNNKHKEILLLLYTMNTRNDNEPRGRTYIREWKRKDYAKNGDKIKAKNKAYYYKRKFGLNCEDMKRYDVYLPLVAKIVDNLNKLQDEKPELIQDILQKYA